MMPDWQDSVPQPTEMVPDGPYAVEAIETLTPPEEGEFTLTVALLDGEEHLQWLQLPLVVSKPGQG